VSGSRVLLLGLAYKRNTGDAREAPGTVIAQSLAALGAEVRVADPHLSGDSTAFPLVEANAEELSSADAVVVVTDHDAFDYELVRAHARYVLDTRNRLDGPTVERL
jgi:UDP-N-acetyl-D-glucosamine dehydrogenase